MKFHVKAVIFDLDGVICFTDEFHYQGMHPAVERKIMI